ncbi:hypothetical protein [Rudanella paleaurantiibacter]|uniref:hypothetical protein n=1 Tax=Rudanella paleaurantiibacter TaxID=2614655 RepID=UPI001625B793|nr:hypothetical protein [Rudanella paleaurantiibacter]
MNAFAVVPLFITGLFDDTLMMTTSLEVGTPEGLQLLAVAQLLVVPSQVLSTAKPSRDKPIVSKKSRR